MLASCTKQLDVIPSNPTPTSSKSHDALANYPFNWELALKMPKTSLPGAPDVPMPWKSQVGTPINPGIINDYKESDGWELVYNSFSPDNFPNSSDQGTIATVSGQPSGGLYFALYNRYRGLLRYYYYTPPATYTNSTQFSHGLSLYSNGSSSKVLNFVGKNIVDPIAPNTNSFLQTNADGIAYGGGWYAMQYELAYDPALAGTTYPNPGFEWTIRTITTTDITLDGKETSTIKGTSTKADPPSGFNWIGATLGAIEIVSGIVSGTAATDAIAGVAQAINSGSSGSTKDFLSGTFGQTSSGDQTIDLTMTGTITTTGNAVTNLPFLDNSFALPGQQAGNGIAPLYLKPVGVFNLSQRPTVTKHSVIQRSPIRGGNSDYSCDFALNTAAVRSLIQYNNVLFDPSDPKGASLDEVSVSLVVLNPGPLWYSADTRETIGSGFGYSSSPSTTTAYVNLSYNGSALSGGITGVPVVRVSLWLKPNNGSPRVHIVKSFVADVQTI
jgi:hypothetical protein